MLQLKLNAVLAVLKPSDFLRMGKALFPISPSYQAGRRFDILYTPAQLSPACSSESSRQAAEVAGRQARARARESRGRVGLGDIKCFYGSGGYKRF